MDNDIGCLHDLPDRIDVDEEQHQLESRGVDETRVIEDPALEVEQHAQREKAVRSSEQIY